MHGPQHTAQTQGIQTALSADRLRQAVVCSLQISEQHPVRRSERFNLTCVRAAIQRNIDAQCSKSATHLRSQMTRFELASQRLDSRCQQVSHRVVELGQVDADPCSEEDDIAHEGLVFKGCTEGAVLALLHSWSQSLKSKE